MNLRHAKLTRTIIGCAFSNASPQAIVDERDAKTEESKYDPVHPVHPCHLWIDPCSTQFNQLLTGVSRKNKAESSQVVEGAGFSKNTARPLAAVVIENSPAEKRYRS